MREPYWPPTGSAALRRGRWSERGQVYLATFTTFERRGYFHDFGLACRAAKAMHEFSEHGPTRVLASVLMPDHWHGLVELGEGDRISRWVGELKGSVAFALRKQQPGLGRIRAKGFHDHALRRDEDLLGCARYIVLNPVRAGLVRRVGDYSFWNAVWL